MCGQVQDQWVNIKFKVRLVEGVTKWEKMWSKYKIFVGKLPGQQLHRNTDEMLGAYTI